MVGHSEIERHSRLANFFTAFLLKSQQQHGSIRSQKIVNSLYLTPKEIFYDCRREITSLDPNYFRRGSHPFRQMNEVAVSTDQSRECHPASPIEYEWVRGADKVMRIDALQPRDNVGQLPDQFWREVLVEKDAHRSLTTVGGISHICGEGIHGREIFLLKARVLLENLLLRHAMSQPA